MPNGLPQAMQWNGSSSFTTASGAFQALKSSRGSSVMTSLRTGRFAKPALHAQAFGKSQHRRGRDCPTAHGSDRRRRRRGKRAAVDVEIDAAERRARRQRHDIDRRGRGADASSRNVVSSTPRLAPRGTKPAGFASRRHAAAASSMARNWSGSSVSIDPHAGPAPKPSAEIMFSDISTDRRSPEISCLGLARVRIATPLPP